MQALWTPTPEIIANANITDLMREFGFKTVGECYAWSTHHFCDYWQAMLQRLDIVFKTPYQTLCDLNNGVEQPDWLVGASLNIADSCFNADPKKIAIIAQAENGSLFTWTYEKLNQLSNQIANGLVQHGFNPGDTIAIDMPMTAEAVAIYLGIIKAGCVVISIADSFSPAEIHTRLTIANAKGIFTQDCIVRANKHLPLYEKIVEANAPRAIVLPCATNLQVKLRPYDLVFSEFLSDNVVFASRTQQPNDMINILFSSGTTGDPKAIPWTQLTPIKAAADGYIHQNIKPSSVVTWPTNLGWMMGPWLIFAALINKACIALYYGAPTNAEYGKFLQDAKVTMAGTVPSIIKTWRATGVMAPFDFSHIELFTSTGEASNPEDMAYLMALAGNKPVIEYCGGTELGGGYLASTIIEPCIPSTFSTPALGMGMRIIDEHGQPTRNGEVALVPPSIGMSQKLLNRDHHEIYFAGMPKASDGCVLRRHGDQVEQLENGYYRELGRIDDTMNLGGIKVSSAEIERSLVGIDTIKETAAIAVNPPGGGPSLLIIYAVLRSSDMQVTPQELKQQMQELIRTNLNPLFKISEVILIDALPRTASNKVMRRVLRDKYGN